MASELPQDLQTGLRGMVAALHDHKVRFALIGALAGVSGYRGFQGARRQ
jgi:hypothetical protein